MKNNKFLIAFLCGVLLCVIFAFKTAPNDNRMNIKEAFDQGKIELKFEAFENGNVLEITVLNLTTGSISLFIAEGTTSFTDNISIITTQQQNLVISANGKTTFKVNQKPGGMISGSVTLRKQPTTNASDSKTTVNSKDIKTALASGDITLILEGIENGEKLNIKAEKKNDSTTSISYP